MPSKRRLPGKNIMHVTAIAARRHTPRNGSKSFARQATLIRLAPESAIEGFEVLLHHGQVKALPDNKYVVGPEHIGLLDEAGITYQIEHE